MGGGGGEKKKGKNARGFRSFQFAFRWFRPTDRQVKRFVSVALIKFAFLLRGGPRSHYRYQFYQWRNVSRNDDDSEFRSSASFEKNRE